MEGMNSMGLRVNFNKIKMVITRIGGDSAVIEGVWPCAVCLRGVGGNYGCGV